MSMRATLHAHRDLRLISIGVALTRYVGYYIKADGHGICFQEKIDLVRICKRFTTYNTYKKRKGEIASNFYKNIYIF